MKFAILSTLCLFLVAAQVEEAVVSEAQVEQAVADVEVEEEPAFLVNSRSDVKGRGHCVRRFASSSSSSDSCDCCDECRKVYYDWLDFYTSYPTFDTIDIEGTWTYYTIVPYGNVNLTYVANDGALGTSCAGGVLSANVFTKYQVNLTDYPEIDHAKYWAYAKVPIPIPVHGDSVVKWAANVQTFKTESNPFPSAIVERNDFRFANGQFMAFDPVTGFNFAFVLTNHRVYIMYQRMFDYPLFQPKQGGVNTGRAAFTFIIPVKIRRVCDWHDLEIVFHGDSHEVSYHVDEQEVFVLNQVGFRLERQYMVEDIGGIEEIAWPESVYYGLGAFTGVDYYPACQRAESCRDCQFPFIRQSLTQLNLGTYFTQYNPIFGPNTPAVYYAVSGAGPEYKIWGQGLVSKIRKLIAYQRVPVC